MEKYKRIFLIVLDSLGIGYQPDAHKYGDEGANTLKRISRSNKFKIPTLTSLGIGNIDGVDYIEKVNPKRSAVARLCEVSVGKDTTVGHFELMGIISDKPFPTYPTGFPEAIISEFSKATGRQVLCNKPYSGTEVISDYAEEHIKSGGLIVYTSADSVFQIAAHEAIVPPETLYEYCKAARKILVGEHAVARVIARPFIEENGKYTRTENRRDFSIIPPKASVLDSLKAGGFDIISVGKINDIFSGCGITEAFPSHSNREGMEITSALLEKDFHGLAFINLVDFDMLYGHRQDIDGYANALSEFDLWLSGFIDRLSDDDLLIITADHGCDPGDNSTDHTREYVPLIAYNNGIKGENFGTQIGFSVVGDAILKLLGGKPI